MGKVKERTTSDMICVCMKNRNCDKGVLEVILNHLLINDVTVI